MRCSTPTPAGPPPVQAQCPRSVVCPAAAQIRSTQWVQHRVFLVVDGNVAITQSHDGLPPGDLSLSCLLRQGSDQS